MVKKIEQEKRRGLRTRHKIRKSAIKADKCRLTVFRSNMHIYAQIIDDTKGITVFSASSLDKDMRVSLQKGWNLEAAEKVGQKLAEKAKKAGLTKVVFDRGPYLYHGRVKALATGARAGGLEF